MSQQYRLGCSIRTFSLPFAAEFSRYGALTQGG
jgi:hypothetical protein